ncbi:MAG: cyclic nucleotide-binding protein [Hyphomicrobiales bacterium]|nr:cyclic nucleotide-binding protein [Hyphomicrobiales bacterium]
MSESGNLSSPNHFLNALSEWDRALVFQHSERVDLSLGQTLMRADAPLDFVHFIEQGIVSIVAQAPGRSLEVACVGRRRLLGLHIILGRNQSSLRAHVQIPGSALRMRAVDLHSAMAASDTFRSALLAYASNALIDMAQNVVAAGCCNVVQRLAGHLLELSEQLDNPSIPLTHDELARALGVRRASVTLAIHVLEGERAIRSLRSLTLVTDSKKLRKLSSHEATVGVPKRRTRL